MIDNCIQGGQLPTSCNSNIGNANESFGNNLITPLLIPQDSNEDLLNFTNPENLLMEMSDSRIELNPAQESLTDFNEVIKTDAVNSRENLLDDDNKEESPLIGHTTDRSAYKNNFRKKAPPKLEAPMILNFSHRSHYSRDNSSKASSYSRSPRPNIQKKSIQNNQFFSKNRDSEVFKPTPAHHVKHSFYPSKRYSHTQNLLEAPKSATRKRRPKTPEAMRLSEYHSTYDNTASNTLAPGWGIPKNYRDKSAPNSKY